MLMWIIYFVYIAIYIVLIWYFNQKRNRIKEWEMPYFSLFLLNWIVFDIVLNKYGYSIPIFKFMDLDLVIAAVFILSDSILKYRRKFTS